MLEGIKSDKKPYTVRQNLAELITTFNQPYFDAQTKGHGIFLGSLNISKPREPQARPVFDESLVSDSLKGLIASSHLGELNNEEWRIAHSVFESCDEKTLDCQCAPVSSIEYIRNKNGGLISAGFLKTKCAHFDAAAMAEQQRIICESLNANMQIPTDCDCFVKHLEQAYINKAKKKNTRNPKVDPAPSLAACRNPR